MFDLTNFSGGAVFGVMFFVLLTILFGEPVNQKILDTCAKKHGVYECEIVAVPKTKVCGK